MKNSLLHLFNRIVWIYAYLGLIYALYFIYFIVVPTYREQNRLSHGGYVIFNIVFLYFFSQGYLNLIRTTFTSVPLGSHARERSHYCKFCRCSIPIRDHHCFFVGTCIGEHNQRYFLLMLFHLLCAHLLGYLFVGKYLWEEVDGLHLVTIPRILFFNVGYLLGFVKSKWQAFICLHHYLVYFDIALIGRLFYQMMRRALNGQTEYEEKKGMKGNKQTFEQIFGAKKWRLIVPFVRP